jgi:hypothetical protein
MRWLSDPADPRELESKRRLLSGIDHFWSEFVKKAPEIDAHIKGCLEWDLHSWMAVSLAGIEGGIDDWEFGPAIGATGHRLVISAGSDRLQQPLIQNIVKRAPTITGWQFYAYRLPESFETTLNIIKAKGGADPTDLKFRAQLNKQREIELTFASRLDTEKTERTAVLATISLLGEEILNKWIGDGGIKVEKTGAFDGFRRLFRRQDDGKMYRPISDLKPTVDTLISSVHDQLSSKPLFEGDTRPVVYNAEGKQLCGQLFRVDRKLPPMDDYPMWVDLYVGTSSYPEIFHAGYLTSKFSSARFSKVGELFGCLKIDGRNGLEVFKDRGAIEDAIDDVLIKNKAGCTIGGGTGHVYSYITLAIADLPKTVDLLRQVLQKGKIPKRSWLLFFDPEYWDEWIGIWDDTPPPPSVA